LANSSNSNDHRANERLAAARMSQRNNSRQLETLTAGSNQEILVDQVYILSNPQSPLVPHVNESNGRQSVAAEVVRAAAAASN
jgi:hypothetical protein